MKNIIKNLIANGTLTEDQGKVINGIQLFKSAGNHNIYTYNPKTKRAYRYNENGDNGRQITLQEYNVQVSAIKARKDAELARLDREKITEAKASTKTVSLYHRDRNGDVTNNDTLTVPEKSAADDEILLYNEDLWVEQRAKSFTWEPGTYITIRAMKQTGEDKPTIWLDEDGYHVIFEEVRSENGDAVQTGKTVTYTFAANQKSVDSFKKAINKRSDNWFWNRLNEGVENRWDCKPVTTINLNVFFKYLRKFPVKVLFDFTEWTDELGELHQSTYPKVRLWLPEDFVRDETKNRKHLNIKATF